MKKHNKKIIASTLALALLATGTFAWQSFSQLATNEIIDKGAIAGGRLHDYFSGSNSITDTGKVQEVFLENYAGDEDNPVGLSSMAAYVYQSIWNTVQVLGFYNQRSMQVTFKPQIEGMT